MRRCLRDAGRRNRHFDRTCKAIRLAIASPSPVDADAVQCGAFVYVVFLWWAEEEKMRFMLTSCSILVEQPSAEFLPEIAPWSPCPG
jgi:hypothetical protein